MAAMKIGSPHSPPKSVAVQDTGPSKGALDLKDTVKVTYRNGKSFNTSVRDFVGGKIPGINRFGPFSISRDRLHAISKELPTINKDVENYRSSPDVVKKDAQELGKGFIDRNPNTRFYAMQEYGKIIPYLDPSNAKEGAAALRKLLKDPDNENRHTAASLLKDLIPKMDKATLVTELKALRQSANDPSVDDKIKAKIDGLIDMLEKSN